MTKSYSLFVLGLLSSCGAYARTLPACEKPHLDEHVQVKKVVVYCDREHVLMGDWTDYLYDRPSERTIKLVKAYMDDLGLAEPRPLSEAEGLWIAERIEKKDWKLLGYNTVHEGLRDFLGLPPE